jgi:protein O-GlcNAc transferase
MNSQLNALIPQAIEHLQNGNFVKAEALLKNVLQVNPGSFDALLVMGVIYVMQKRHPEAAVYFKKAIEINPGNSVAHFNLATALSESGNDTEALLHHEQAVKLAPNDQDAWINYGRSLSNLKQYDKALDCYENVLKINPGNAQALSNQGAILAGLRRDEEALSCFERALAINPSFPATWSNTGNTLNKLKRYDEALAHYDRAIQLDPDYADTWSNKGNALSNLKRYDEALAHYDRAIRLEPDNADAWYNKGYTLSNLKRYSEALAHYDRAVQITPENADVWYKKANALNELKRYDEALAHYDQAIKLKPNHDYFYGDRLSTKMSICDWTEVDVQLAELVNKIESNVNAATPFTLLGIKDSPSLQRKVAGTYAQNFPANRLLGKISKRPSTGKIRVGYYSNEFHNHATAFLTAELFEMHDRNKFEVLAFSFGADRNDAMRNRLRSSFDQFINVRNKSDQEIAQLSREMEVDIAVDLQGYQTEHRAGIFAYQAAPIQVNYLAYPGTMGTECIDYIIADRTLIPPESQQYYSEKIVYLPDTYQANDRRRAISDSKFTREELGMPSAGFVFCCFNTNYKITPKTFSGWIKILKEVDGSVLWLLEGSQIAVRNLQNEAEKRGVSAGRLIFAKHMNLPEHLARHRLADLFLDTLPYNAHTTASDALWAGLPVLTCQGESFASRVASSLLNAIHLPELIAHSQEDYEQLAIELAKHPARLAEIKKKLANNRLTTPLFDTPRYTKHLEAAYTAMYKRYQADLLPDHIYVQPE